MKQMENLLYYPYINLPRTDWTARTLLYYDKIGSIVPQDYFYNPEKYEPFMRRMVQEELVIPLNPLEVLDRPWELSEPFIKYIHSPDLSLAKRVKYFQEGLSGKRKFTGIKIHMDKFEYNTFHQLSEVGLAKRNNNDWFIVEKHTAKELMTFLATVIGH